MYLLEMTETAETEYKRLRDQPALAKRNKAVSKALRLLAANPRHPGLNTHVWRGSNCPHGDTLFEAYAENNTPGAYRIFFCYPPKKPGVICIVAITPHP